MARTETAAQRGARRYGPLAGIAAVVLVVGLLVARTDPAVTTSAGGGPAAGVGGGGNSSVSTVPGAKIVDDGQRAISFSEARAAGLDLAFGEGCDKERGHIAIPTAFAPECYAKRQAGGGATSMGVTATSIRIVLYQAPPDPLIDQIFAAIGFTDTREDVLKTYQGYIDIYQQYFELYGRKIELVPFVGTGSSLDEIAARADATNIADGLKPFAVFGGPLLTSAFGDELAARKVIQVDLASTKGNAFFADHSPYSYNVLAAPDQTSAVVAEYLGKRLKGRPAVHAGDPELAKATRKFGLLFLSITDPTAEVLRLKFDEQLKAQGIELAVQAGSVDPTASAAQQIAKLKEAGVTTVLFVGDPLSPKTFTVEATSQNYFPEWFITGSSLTDSTTFARTYDPKQWGHAFGISQLFARGKPEANWSYALYKWYFGTPPPAQNAAQIVFPFPTILMTGIMAAGPNLTPESLQAAAFALKPVGGGLTVPQVSFGNKGFFPDTDYNGIDDAVEIWFDPKATGPDERGKDGVGMYRYVDGGKRYLPGKWPTGDPKLFTTDGSAVALYEQIPEADRPVDYPPPKR